MERLLWLTSFPLPLKLLDANSRPWTLERPHSDTSNTERLMATTNLYCDVVDFNDCLYWATLRLIRCKFIINRVQPSKLTDAGQRLAYLRLKNCVDQVSESPVALQPKPPLAQAQVEYQIGAVSDTQRRLLLEILEWNTYCRRPLEPRELLVALSTKTELDRQRLTMPHASQLPKLTSEGEMLEICKGLLELSEDGVLDFVDHAVKTFLMSPEAQSLGIRSASEAHETMAAVCLRHIACLTQQAILRPWVLIGRVLRGEIDRCRFRDYSILYWHEHFRVAKPTSRYLPFLLHHTAQAAFKLESCPSEDTIPNTSPQWNINGGLWVCSLFDSKILGQTYLDMGASLSTGYVDNGITMLHVAAANKSTEVTQLLLQRGADVEGQIEYKGSLARRTSRTPLHIAASHGHLPIMKLLIEAGANVNATTLCTGKTSLQLAVEFGHEEVVRLLLNGDAKFVVGGHQQHDLAELACVCGHPNIARLLTRKASMVTNLTSSTDVGKTYLLESDGFEDANDLMQCLSLEEGDKRDMTEKSPQTRRSDGVSAASSDSEIESSDELSDVDGDSWSLIDAEERRMDDN